MKRRSLAGNVALLFFVVGFVLVFVAFGTSSWLVSDRRIPGAKLDRLGLWAHCFHSLEVPSPENGVTFVGCRWIYDPFTTGYDQIRGFLVPPFMIATQFFYTLCFVSVLLGAVFSLMYLLCCAPDEGRFVQLVRILGFDLLVGGVSGGVAVVVFASLGNRSGWMPGHENNFFGWSFVVACVGAVVVTVSSVLFFVDASVFERKKRLAQKTPT